MENEQVQTDASKNGVLLLNSFLMAQNQFKIFHWQTRSYSQHNAFEKIYDSLSENIDMFVEVFMGKYGRIMADPAFSISLQNLSDSSVGFADRFINFLVNVLPTFLDPKNDTDLLNIRDEMLADANQLKYLLTLS